MVTLPFALSVHHFISSVGADAGFAAFIAVALLVLLYFSQARETATLRRRADEAGQRVQELESELAALADHVAALPAEISVRAAGPRAPAYAGAPAPVPAGVSSAGANLPPAAPAGVGAPALAAATRLIPDPTRSIEQPHPAPVGLVNGPVDQATQVDSSAVTVGGGNGSSHRPVAAPAATMQRPVQARSGGPPRSPGGPPRGAQGRYPAAQGRPRAPQGRPAGAPQSMMSVRHGETRSGVGKLFVILAALLGIAAVVTGVLVIKNINSSSSKSKSDSASSAAARTAASRRAAPVAAVNPATVTVAVLNGTNTNGLAGKVQEKLDAAGYQQGYKGNFTANQTQSSTLVQYMRGYKRDASAVASSLKLPPRSVQPLDSATQQLACPASQGPCKSAVVVTVGSDLSSLATQ
jgi:hypothetical protein